jgi:hypothetical protein
VPANASKSASPSPSPSPKAPGEDHDDVTAETGSTFNTGQKTKRKNAKDNKSETLVDLFVRQLEVTEQKREEQRQHLARSEEREEKIVNLLTALVTHHIKGQSRQTE